MPSDYDVLQFILQASGAVHLLKMSVYAGKFMYGEIKDVWLLIRKDDEPKKNNDDRGH